MRSSIAQQAAVGQEARTTRFVSRLHAAGLDARLCAGEELESAPELAARAHALTRRRVRRRIAAGLVTAAERGYRRRGGALSARVPVQLEARHAAAGPLSELARRLRDDDRPPRAQGIALARSLVVDPASALHAHCAPGVLTTEVVRALTACDRQLVPGR